METVDMKLLLAFYADDFTGSTDALECLARAGLRCALFLEPPTEAQRAKYPGLQALGIAGKTRSLPPAEMEAELRPALTALRKLGAAQVHYKVCSTFDSSPRVGSIGRAIEIGSSVFGGNYVPVLAAAPGLGRYTVFGNHFARMGAGTAGAIYRLDRHPSMSRHPVTPAEESDLRLHLAKQTQLALNLVDVLQVEQPTAETLSLLGAFRQGPKSAVLFDALTDDHLRRIGRILGRLGSPTEPLFSVGSSGVDTALCHYFAEMGLTSERHLWPSPGPVESLLVVSGSCSPVTAGQIEWACNQGFVGVPLDAAGLAAGQGFEVAAQSTVNALGSGKRVVAYTSLGKTDTNLDTEAAKNLGLTLGNLAREALARTGVRRLVVAGGDSSSYAGRALGIEALEMFAPLAPGAPLCLARAPGSPADGCEVNFKGGQVGAPSYFGSLAEGRLLN